MNNKQNKKNKRPVHTLQEKTQVMYWWWYIPLLN